MAEQQKPVTLAVLTAVSVIGGLLAFLIPLLIGNGISVGSVIPLFVSFLLLSRLLKFRNGELAELKRVDPVAARAWVRSAVMWSIGAVVGCGLLIGLWSFIQIRNEESEQRRWNLRSEAQALIREECGETYSVLGYLPSLEGLSGPVLTANGQWLDENLDDNSDFFGLVEQMGDAEGFQTLLCFQWGTSDVDEAACFLDDGFEGPVQFTQTITIVDLTDAAEADQPRTASRTDLVDCEERDTSTEEFNALLAEAIAS